MTALILFSSTTFLFTPLICVLLFPLMGARIMFGGRMKIRLTSMQLLGLALISAATIVAIVIFIMFGPTIQNFERSIIGEFPYLILILLSIVIGRLLSRKDLDVLLLLIGLEVSIGSLQYLMGVHSFFIPAHSEAGFGESGLLYYSRVYGLSDSASSLAFKVLIAFSIIMLNYERYPKYWRAFFFTLILVGLFITFNRTTMLAVILGGMWFFRKKIGLARLTVTIMAGVIATRFFIDEVARQLFRGMDSIDLSGRDFVFGFFYDFILINPAIGNAGAKVWVYFGDRLYHAHNSYLELLASNGLLVSIPFVIGYGLLLLRAHNLAAPILIYSMLQYGIWWGFGFHDIVASAIFFQYCDGLARAERYCLRLRSCKTVGRDCARV